MLLLLRFLTLVAPALAAPAAAADRRSLEELLREARAHRDAVQAELTTVVEDTMTQLEELAGSVRTGDVAALRERLLGLGPPAAPALVPYLDPGENQPVAAVFRARVVVEVLGVLASPAITDELLRLAAEGPLLRRCNALAVLATSPEPARVVGALQGLLHASEPEVREAALGALGRLGGPQALEALRGALEDPEPKVVDAALASLGAVSSPEVAQLVLALLARAGAETHLAALTKFYAARPALLALEEHQAVLAELVVRPAAAKSDVIGMLELWNRHEVEPRPATRRTLGALSEHVNDVLREHVLILLARAKDKSARRDFLAPYNDQVARQEDYHEVYTGRGVAYYRLAEYTNAIKDFRDAIAKQSARNPDAAPYLGLARAYARMGRFKDAADYLNKAPVALPVLRALASDPAFAEMLETRYRDSFQLDE